jgi:peptidyl-tRNA hydrolase, PTH1 family
MSIISKSPFNFKLGWGDTRSKLEPEQNISKQNEGFVKLVVGLGNTGTEYVGTRHNIGFEIIDLYAKNEDFPAFKDSKKFFGLITEKFINGKKIILLKPTTLMNLSGKSVRAVRDFYNISPEDITVIHDELDLNFGDIRKKDGGEGKSSHNGLKDISLKLKTTDYKRIRFGIKSPILAMMDAKVFVLGKFNKEEQSKLKSLIKEAVDLI